MSRSSITYDVSASTAIDVFFSASRPTAKAEGDDLCKSDVDGVNTDEEETER